MDEQKPKKEWVREFSAGGLVYKRKQGVTYLLLIEPKGPHWGPPVGYWSYPKGRIGDSDPSDTPESAALREVREEGGVSGKIVEKLGDIKYTFEWEGRNIFKIVTYYLMEYLDGDPSDHDHEVAQAAWFPLHQVPDKLKFSHDKAIFKKASELLNPR